MTMMKILVGSGLIALAAATPAAAQYANPYAYGYGNSGYGYSGYGYNNAAQFAAQRCSAAVQQRLNTRIGRQGILGTILGVQPARGRVLSVTQVNPRRQTIRVRGLATSGMAYDPYGMGAYGALAYNYRPDLSFRCSVDYRGYIRDIDINRR